MARHKRFGFACDKYELAMIAALAERLRRSQSDAVRFVVLEAAMREPLTRRGALPRYPLIAAPSEQHAISA